MTKQEILQKLIGLVEQFTDLNQANDIKVLRTEYLKSLETIKREQYEDFVESGGNRKEFEYHLDADDNQFEALMVKYKEKLKKMEQQKAEHDRKNLEERVQIIEQINALVKNEEHIGKAITQLRDLQEKWRNAGAVASDKYRSLQNDYSKAVEDFNYNLKIFKQLQEHDLKRNFDLKKEVITKVIALMDKTSIKEIESLLRTYRNDWEDIGPVTGEKWIELKEEYRKAVDGVYQKIKDHHDNQKLQREKNLEAKNALCEKVETAFKEYPASQKGFNNKTEELLKFQNEWKLIGSADKKAEEEVWKRFRKVCDDFFSAKRQFFSGLKETFESARMQKQALIEKAEALKESTDWKNTSNELIRIQKEWQKIGPCAQHVEQKLWNQFRTACNAFFDKRTKTQEEQDKQFLNNLTKKEAYLAGIKESVAQNPITERDKVHSIIKEWNEMGHVPLADKKRLNDDFYHLVDQLFEKLSLNEVERNKLRYETKLEKMLSQDNPQKALDNELSFVKKKMDELTGDLMKYENNLGFLNKNAGELRKNVEEKIEHTKALIAEWKQKMQMIQKATRIINKTPVQS